MQNKSTCVTFVKNCSTQSTLTPNSFSLLQHLTCKGHGRWERGYKLLSSLSSPWCTTHAPMYTYSNLLRTLYINIAQISWCSLLHCHANGWNSTKDKQKKPYLNTDVKLILMFHLNDTVWWCIMKYLAVATILVGYCSQLGQNTNFSRK